jgi:crotonobetainyl-CoA:carnitine CoA-transferase CaiB-like acyl-CoA transferase
MSPDATAPLADIRVLDASRVLAGPLCGQILGDLGAEVIKVERPGSGDDTRTWGPPFAGELSAYFLSCNRNKKGIALDLGRPEGLELFYALAEKSDVLLENFRAASASKLGLSPDKLHARNPRLIICSISGFGRTGPLSEVPGYDFAIQGLSGLMSITGPVEGPPYKVGVAITDVVTGLYGAIAVLACLNARRRSGHGYDVDLALLDCAVAAQVNLVQAYLTSGVVPPRQGNAHYQIVPYQTFATADDWIIVAVGNEGQWQRLCELAGCPELADDERFLNNAARVQNRGVLVPILEGVFKSRTTAAWERLLRDAEIPHAPVWNYAQLFGQDQAKERGLRVSVRDPQGRAVDLAGSPFHISGAAHPSPLLPPELGQHTEAVLGEVLGVGADRLAELRRNGIIQ